MAVVTDIRIQDTFFDNRKIVKLKRKHGAEALLCLIRLWMYTAKNAPKGWLFDMDAEDIEIASGWTGEPGVFVASLLEFALIDEANGIHAIHDWEDCQPWAFKSDSRSTRASLGGKAKAARVLEAQELAAASMLKADCKHATSNAPSLSLPLPPSPIPSKPKTTRAQAPAGLDADRFARFWAAYPKHKAKATAERAWAKIAPDDALLDMILSAIEWQRKTPDWLKDKGEYIPHPSTYLNNRRWEDERPGNHNGTRPVEQEDDVAIALRMLKEGAEAARRDEAAALAAKQAGAQRSSRLKTTKPNAPCWVLC